MTDFTDQSNVPRTAKAKRMLDKLAQRDRESIYFYGDGYPNWDALSRDASAAKEVLAELVDLAPEGSLSGDDDAGIEQVLAHAEKEVQQALSRMLRQLSSVAIRDVVLGLSLHLTGDRVDDLSCSLAITIGKGTRHG